MAAPAFTPVVVVAAALAILQCAGSIGLEALNQRHARAHAHSIPEAFKNSLSPETHRRSVEYTLAKGRLSIVSAILDLVVFLAVIASGILPASAGWMALDSASSPWWAATWLLGVGTALSLPSLPLDWWAQFRLEARFGFNTTTPGTWVADRIKGLALSAALGLPLLALLLFLVRAMGSLWWLWGFVAIAAFQVLVLFLAPAVILPLFNKFTPLPDGPLKDRLLALGERTGFHAATIQVMDGSRRSRHANAFFTGFGRFRKIALFDTLVEQLTPEEIEAVLAHEIGHHQRRHIPRRLATAMLMMLAGFGAMGWLATQPWFAAGFGFAPGTGIAPTLLLFALVSPAALFWASPISHHWSRVHEFEADGYACNAMGSPVPLVTALRKLSEKNLSNLTPHPWYSAFHYSHPTLVEREAALLACRGSGTSVDASGPAIPPTH